MKPHHAAEAPLKSQFLNLNYCLFVSFHRLLPTSLFFSICSQLRYLFLNLSFDPPPCSCSPMFPQRSTVCMKKGSDTRKKSSFCSLFCGSVLWLLPPPPPRKNAILLFLSNCASCLLLVLSLVFSPFLNNFVSLPVRLYTPQHTIHPPPHPEVSHSKKPKRKWVKLEQLRTCKKKNKIKNKKRLAKHWISPRRKTGTDI